MTTFKSLRNHPCLEEEPDFTLYWFENSWVLAGPNNLQRLDRLKITYDNLGDPYIAFARVNGEMAIELSEVLPLAKECENKCVPHVLDSELLRRFKDDINPPTVLSLFQAEDSDLFPIGSKSVMLAWNEAPSYHDQGFVSWQHKAFSSIAEALEASESIECEDFRMAIAFKLGGQILSFLSPILEEKDWVLDKPEDSDLWDKLHQVLRADHE